MNKIADIGCGVMLWIMVMALFSLSLLFLAVSSVAVVGN